MDNRLKESLSALMDDEANELEIHRLLSQTDEQEVRAAWSRYHKVREVLQQSGQEQVPAHFDVSASVRAAISAETQESAAPPIVTSEKDTPAVVLEKPDYFFRKAIGIAACALFALILVVDQPSIETAPLTAAIEDAGIDSQPFISDEAYFVQNLPQDEPRIIVEFSDEHAAKFNEYLLRHAEHAAYSPASGVTSIARVASFNSAGP